MNRLIMPTLNERSSLVHVRYRRLPTRLRYLLASTCSPSSYFESFAPGSIGIDTGLQFSISYFFKISFAYVSCDIKKLPDHEEENRDSEQQPKIAVDKSVEKSQLQTVKLLNEHLLKETHEKRKEFGAMVQTKEGLELDLKKNADEKKQSQMDKVGDRICRLVEIERLKNVEIGRLKDENNGLVLKVEEEREKWTKVWCERDGIKANSDGLFEQIGDQRKKMIEMKKNEKREEIEDLKVKCKKLLAEKMESEIMN